jgi:hypothetical protein
LLYPRVANCNIRVPLTVPATTTWARPALRLQVAD